MSLTLLIMGLFFTASGISVWFLHSRIVKSCTEPLYAMVTALEEHEEEGRHNSLHPVITYSVNGTEYHKVSGSGTFKPFCQVGEHIQIHVNPNSPDQFYIDYNLKTNKIAAAIISAILLMVGILITVICITG